LICLNKNAFCLSRATTFFSIPWKRKTIKKWVIQF